MISTNANDYGSVTDEDISDFCTAKNMHQPLCPMCQHRQWALAGASNNVPGLMQAGKDGSMTMPTQFVAMALLTCNNCAYVRMHSLTAIANWKLTRASQP
jgi:hypothetical protein